MIGLPFVLLKPLFNMLGKYSCNPSSCPALPVHYMHVVLAPVWRRANFRTKLSSSSSGHVQGTHSSPTLGSCSLTSYFSPLSQFLSPPGRAIFYLHPISPQTCKPKSYQLLLSLLNWLTIPTGAHSVIRLWECFAVYLSCKAEEKAFECHHILGLSVSRLTGSDTASFVHNS